MKCFICKKEYDPKNRPYVATILNRRTQEKCEIRNVSVSEGILAMCPNCLKALLLGYYLSVPVEFRSFDVVDIPIVVEEE